ncbi:MAG: histidinol-phosphate transaminase [Burkholderiaceae bacterium]
MSMFWSSVVHGLSPYVPGEQPKIVDLIKLNTNENPYPPSPRVVSALQDELEGDGASLRLYPDPASMAVRQAAAADWGLSSNEVFVGNGSDEVLAFAFQALLNHPSRGPLVFPDISYSFYPSYCRLYGIGFAEFALNSRFEIDLSQIPAEAGAVIFPNPNAPTGLALSRNVIQAFLRERPELMVVVDEAYVDFGAESCVPLIREHPNLLVTQSLSKSRALAGLRVGLAFGAEPLIDALIRVKDSFNSYPVDRLAGRAAVEALRDTDWLTDNRSRIQNDRSFLSTSLTALGFEVLPSMANFVFARHPGYRGAWLMQELRNRKILVRQFSRPRIEDFLRITIGTPEQCQRLVDALKEIIGASAIGASTPGPLPR